MGANDLGIWVEDLNELKKDDSLAKRDLESGGGGSLAPKLCRTKKVRKGLVGNFFY